MRPRFERQHHGAQETSPTIIAAAAASPIGQSSNNGTRLTGAGGDDPAEPADAVARARPGEPAAGAAMPDDPAAIADEGAVTPDAAADDLEVVREPEAAVAVDEADVNEVVAVAEAGAAEPAVAVVPLPAFVTPAGLVLLPLGAVRAGTCAAAGAASRRLSSKARRPESIMAVTRALPLPNATGAPQFPALRSETAV